MQGRGEGRGDGGPRRWARREEGRRMSSRWFSNYELLFLSLFPKFLAKVSECFSNLIQK
jgi:hypothetical protein